MWSLKIWKRKTKPKRKGAMDKQEEINFISAWRIARLSYVQMALRAAIELNVFDIIASSGPNAQLSCAEIISKLPTTNPNASNALERLLKFLSINSILLISSRPCQDSNKDQRELTYGLTSESHCLVKNAKGVSARPFVLFHSGKEIIESLYILKDSILNPGHKSVYQAYHGNHLFEDAAKNTKLNDAFNGGLSFLTESMINRVLRFYKGFDGIFEVMDVGGNLGATLEKIISLYPSIRGINFDLPHIVANAPKHPRVEQVGGDMFVSLPKAQTIFLKLILHDWNDDQCVKLLSNCWKALPNNGKVIVAEFLVPEILDNNVDSEIVTMLDFLMFTQMEGKERKLSEYDAIAKAAGFIETKVYPMGQGLHVLEFIKINGTM